MRRRLLCLVLATAAALDSLQISITSRFAANATADDDAFERLARAQRLRDDVVTANDATPLGGWTVAVAPRSSEYEKTAEDRDDDDDDAAVAAGSADVELTERQARALPYRVIREAKRSKAPLERWRELAEDFPWRAAPKQTETGRVPPRPRA